MYAKGVLKRRSESSERKVEKGTDRMPWEEGTKYTKKKMLKNHRGLEGMKTKRKKNRRKKRRKKNGLGYKRKFLYLFLFAKSCWSLKLQVHMKAKSFASKLQGIQHQHLN